MKLLISIIFTGFAFLTIAQPVLTLSEIQGQQAISPYEGQEVTFNAKVTEYYGDSWFMQDDFGAWNGIYVIEPTLLVPPNPPWWNEERQPEVGDELTITGTVVEYQGNTQIKNAVLVEQTEFWLATPAGTMTTAAETQDEALEGTRVRMIEFTVTSSMDGNEEWTVSDGENELTCIGTVEGVVPFPGDVYSVYGAVCEVNGEYKVHVGSIDVISLTTDEINEIKIQIYPNPASDQLQINASQNMRGYRILDLNGKQIKSHIEISRAYQVEIDELSRAVYILELQSDEQQLRRRFVVK